MEIVLVSLAFLVKKFSLVFISFPLVFLGGEGVVFNQFICLWQYNIKVIHY